MRLAPEISQERPSPAISSNLVTVGFFDERDSVVPCFVQIVHADHDMEKSYDYSPISMRPLYMLADHNTGIPCTSHDSRRSREARFFALGSRGACGL